MAIAAVPRYLGQDFRTASPGMRFGMYLKLWGVNERSKEMLWQTHDIVYRIRGRNRQERELKEDTKRSAIDDTCKLADHDLKTVAGLLLRQKNLVNFLDSTQTLHLVAQSIAPFTTGLGNEHPLENGFAFLWPYGVPYLPGSGVKGVLRQAARELAEGQWGESLGWSTEQKFAVCSAKEVVNLSQMDVLFGRESADGDSEHVRGVLSFWDVIPQISGSRLAVEVMTPHQQHYYQREESPHDSGQPNPITFLTVPPKSMFCFTVVCDLPRLKKIAPELYEDEKWKKVLEAAFEHAFDWLGFGAKTAVGYGAMKLDPAVVATRRQEEQRRRKEEQKRAKQEQARRQQEAEQRAREEEERRLKEVQEAEARRLQAEFDALPVHEQALLKAREALGGLPEDGPLNKNRYAVFVGIINKLVENMDSWTAEGRIAVADFVEEQCNRLGWHPSGLKKAKREKRARKWRDLVGKLRSP